MWFVFFSAKKFKIYFLNKTLTVFIHVRSFYMLKNLNPKEENKIKC